MAELIKMPKLSDTMEEGGIASWLKKEGEKIKEGEALLEIETDKATMEYVSPVEGFLLKILVTPGSSVKLQEPIAVVGEKGEVFDLTSLVGPTKKHQFAVVEEKQPEVSKEDKKETHSISTSHVSTKIKASPLAKKLAAQKGLELHTISGTGPLGRIIVRDVENFKVGKTQSAVKRADQKIPLSMMRKTIAKRLLAGKNNAPHFYLTVTVNMDSMWHWRQELNRSLEARDKETVKVSFNDIIILATSRALRSHPMVNASWQEEAILQFGRVDIAMAVALESGLVTPVIRNADELGILDIARQAKSLGAKAKAGQLKPEEFSDGTFTISNLGMTCIEEFTAIINPPQACILAVGTIKPQPYVTREGTLGIQKQMKMTLSCDHRVVDGMVGARFLETLVSYLENPLMMLV